MELPERILSHLSKENSLQSLKLSQKWDLDHQKIVGAIKSLEALGDVVKTVQDTINRWELTGEGKNVAKSGSHESVVFNSVPSGDSGIAQPDLVKAVGAEVGKVGMGKALSKGWIAMDKSSGKPVVKRKVDSIVDAVGEDLRAVAEGKDGKVSPKDKAEYKKRKLLHEVNIKVYVLTKGPKFTTTIEKAETELTPEMIASGSWKSATFKPYNFDALGISPPSGHLHPLLKVRAEYRQIFLEMGFSEMPTNNFVESSFWNFDALFQPQQHPARDAHDTFFISNPATATEFPSDYLERVRRVHSEGGFGSQGYGYDWKMDEAQKNLLRTHTTAVSARMLYKLAQEGFKPQKYFSIDRVFRNETLDATHLAEFHQIEGVIADYGLTLGDLIGVLYQFFQKLGIEKLRFKPAYNPYTEPSMEIFSYHEGLGKWVEIGNSGIFRPEMLLPMGIPEGVNVIAWGLSLERPTMIKYGFDNIRDLCGNRVNLKMVQDNAICRLDKITRDPREILLKITEQRWDNITSKIDAISKKIAALHREHRLKTPIAKASSFRALQSKVPKDLVITGHPSHPPYAVLACLKALLDSGASVWARTHIHSSTTNVPTDLVNFVSCNEAEARTVYAYAVTFVWRSDLSRQPILRVSPSSCIRGEADILRYFSRIVSSSIILPYESTLNAAQLAVVDSKMDAITMSTSPKSLLTGEWACGRNYSLADVLLFSCLARKNELNKDAAFKKWANAMRKMCGDLKSLES